MGQVHRVSPPASCAWTSSANSAHQFGLYNVEQLQHHPTLTLPYLENTLMSGGLRRPLDSSVQSSTAVFSFITRIDMEELAD